MKRLAAFSTIILLFIIITGFGQTAVDPEDFAGQWYSSSDQSVYLFQEGLIYCPKHAVAISDNASISGAYSYCKNSIYLFAIGVNGLETEKALYLVHSGDGSFLCENKDGSGIIYFIRYKE